MQSLKSKRIATLWYEPETSADLVASCDVEPAHAALQDSSTSDRRREYLECSIVLSQRSARLRFDAERAQL